MPNVDALPPDIGAALQAYVRAAQSYSFGVAECVRDDVQRGEAAVMRDRGDTLRTLLAALARDAERWRALLENADVCRALGCIDSAVETSDGGYYVCSTIPFLAYSEGMKLLSDLEEA